MSEKMPKQAQCFKCGRDIPLTDNGLIVNLTTGEGPLCEACYEAEIHETPAVPNPYDVMWQNKPIMNLEKHELVKIIVALADEIDQIAAATQRLSSIGYSRGTLLKPIYAIGADTKLNKWAVYENGQLIEHCETRRSAEEFIREKEKRIN